MSDVPVILVQDMSWQHVRFEPIFLALMIDNLYYFLLYEYESECPVTKNLSTSAKVKMQDVSSCQFLLSGLYVIKVIVVTYSFLAYNIVFF